ncbi:MAG TPA: helix-hairpin-helix domain-containing protein [Solirubrobacteraceae bacterium]|nr:helix-hairpin-helix domain-containing protein [Solirubrobacteraceae bacterium]
MSAITRPQLAVYAAAAVAILLLGARYLSSPAGGGGAGGGAAPARAVAPKTSSVRVEASGSGTAVVQVAGAVRRPGVYRLRADRRVDDAVREAGGPTAKADLAGVNLAAKVSDGQQVIVPAAGAADGAGTAAVPAGAGGGAGAAPGQKLNLNIATPEQLDQVDGVGPATAQKIVAYRQAHGGFRSVTELDQVPGIGEKKLAALKDRLRV